MHGLGALAAVVVAVGAVLGVFFLIAWKMGALRGGGRGEGGQDAGADDGRAVETPYRALSDRNGQPAGVLTPAERAFFAVLRDAVIGLAEELGRPEPLLLAKVRLADLVEVDAAKVGGDRSRRATAQNRINGKHADFVLCHPETTRPLLVIELDDRSHARDDRKARDAFVDAACAAASLPVLHVPAPPPAARYEPRDLARRIAERLGLATTTSGAPLPSPGGRA